MGGGAEDALFGTGMRTATRYALSKARERSGAVAAALKGTAGGKGGFSRTYTGKESKEDSRN